TKAQGTGTIQNDDAAISVTDMSKPEGDSGTSAFGFTVSIPFASLLPVTVHYATVDGTATVANNDYQSTSGDLTFNPGDMTKTVTVPINGDATPEPNETFIVHLSNATNATIAKAQGTGTLQNDDAALSISDVSKPEGDTGTTPFAFTVSIPFA